MFFLSLSVFTLNFAFVNHSALAQPASSPTAPTDLFPCDPAQSDDLFQDCEFNDLLRLVKGVTGKLFTYGMIFSSIIFAYAGFLYLTSQDNPGNRSRANGIMKNVAIGIALMVCAWAMVSLFLTALLDESFLKAVPLKL